MEQEYTLDIRHAASIFLPKMAAYHEDELVSSKKEKNSYMTERMAQIPEAAPIACILTDTN